MNRRRQLGRWLVILGLTLITTRGVIGGAGHDFPTRATTSTLEQGHVASLLDAIAKAGPQGEGSAAARAARDELARNGVEILPQLLVAMDTRNAVAANWYRTIYEDIVRRGASDPQTKWPIAEFKAYVSDVNRVGRPRRLVLSLLDQLDPTFRDQWVPTRLDDPEFRHEAISLVLAAAEKALKSNEIEAAKSQFRKAFQYARDSTQVAQAAGKLQSLGETADVFQHLGLVVDWWLVGPFDAPAKTGFATQFEPEKTVDLKATYRGQSDAKIGWIRHRATDTLGQLNLITALTSTREAVGYAYSEIEVSGEQSAEIRCGADDNCSVWLNGKKVFAREQWLNGTRFDRFITPVTLAAGRNTLLVKVCQGPQHKDPEVPNNWSLQLRLCDAQGRGIDFKPLSPERQ